MATTVGENTQAITNYRDPQKFPRFDAVLWKDLLPLWDLLQNGVSGALGATTVVVMIHEPVNALSGTIVKPVGSTILTGRLPKAMSALASPYVLPANLPSGSNAYTSGGIPIVATLNGSGVYTLSGTPSGGLPVALMYFISISLNDLANVATSRINEEAIVHFDQLPANVFNYRGTFSTAGGAFPTAGGSGPSGSVRRGDCYQVDTGGFIISASIAVNTGDLCIARIDNPAGNFAGHWILLSTSNPPSPTFSITPDEIYDNAGLKLRLRYTHAFMSMGRQGN